MCKTHKLQKNLKISIFMCLVIIPMKLGITSTMLSKSPSFFILFTDLLIKKQKTHNRKKIFAICCTIEGTACILTIEKNRKKHKMSIVFNLNFDDSILSVPTFFPQILIQMFKFFRCELNIILFFNFLN